jgi:sulfur carrier protein ThiS
VTAFALKPLAGGGLRVIAEDLTGAAAKVTLRVGGTATSAAVLRLTGPALLATSGIRIQGAAVAANGSVTPGAPSTVSCSSGSCRLTLAPYSAALVTVG